MNKSKLLPALFAAFLFACFTNAAQAQTTQIQSGINTLTPDASAILDVRSPDNNKGLLVPRMTSAQKNAIPSPAAGLLVYDTTTNCLSQNTGTPAAPNWICSQTTADNGLTKTADNIQLGGALTKASTITTNAANTLAIQGLQTGAATDNIVVTDANGVLKTVTKASIGAGGDNLGNHTATESLKMANNNITGAANTSTQTATIAKGTDGNPAVTGYVAVANDANGNVVWKAANTIGSGDNLGNHTATESLKMANNNITGAANTSTQTVTIAKGTDNNAAVPGYVATSADAYGNVVWKPVITNNIVPSDNGSVMAINGQLLIAQEMTLQMSSDCVIPNTSTVKQITNITNKILDNKNSFIGTSSGNTFTVAVDGVYQVTINVQVSPSINGLWPVLGIYNNSMGRWIARTDDNIPVSAGQLYTYTIITAVDLYASQSYSFSGASSGGSLTLKAYSAGTTGTGPVSFFSVKRLR
jgi:hypothetical protein